MQKTMEDFWGDKKIRQTSLKPVSTHTDTCAQIKHYRTYTFKSHCSLKDCCRRKLVLFSGGSERKERIGERKGETRIYTGGI